MKAFIKIMKQSTKYFLEHPSEVSIYHIKMKEAGEELAKKLNSGEDFYSFARMMSSVGTVLS